MSYKYTVLQDHPVAFFLLDEVKSGTVSSYDSLKSQYATYQDLKDNGVSYAAVAGLPIFDYSGNGQDGFAIRSSDFEVLPIVAAGIRGTEINDNASIALKAPGIATNQYPDDAFSIELWFKPDSSDLGEYPVFADVTNNLGIFYNNENIVFKVNESNSLEHKISRKQAAHVVAVFAKTKMSLYVNGSIVNEKTFTESVKFSNDTLSLSLGPANTGKKFIVDGISIYTYELPSNRINAHYIAGYKETKHSQIVYSQAGILFSLNAVTIRPILSYRYPGIKGLERFISGDAYYDQIRSRLTFEKTELAESKSFSFEETLYITNPQAIVSSLITYGQDVENVVVEVKVPGQDWEVCTNNSPIPYYNKNQNLNSEILDLRVTVTTTDSSFDIPYFDRLDIDFYSDKDFYSDNSGNRIYSDFDYSLGQYNYPIRVQNEHNGLRMIDGHGFSVELSLEPQTVEMFFSPDGGSNVLFSSDNAEFGWNSNGLISSTGINSIYINGVNRTLETNIYNVVLSDILHHVVITLDEPASNIKFNQNQDDSQSGGSNLYSNIAFYEGQFTQAQIINNYRLYCSDNSSIVEESGLQISEDASGVNNTAYYTRSFDDILTIY